MDILHQQKNIKEKASRYLPVSGNNNQNIDSDLYYVSKKYDGHLYSLF